MVFLSNEAMPVFPPRERGWSQVGGPEVAPCDVSPARAGMVPVHGVIGGVLDSFPRASGDGPHYRNSHRRQRQFPPRERGWSQAKGHHHGTFSVSPARAGMVPELTDDERVLVGFPRASGDGPH